MILSLSVTAALYCAAKGVQKATSANAVIPKNPRCIAAPRLSQVKDPAAA